MNMEQKIILVKPEWEQIKTRHEDKCNDLQAVVDNLSENGLTVTTGDLKDLINIGTALYDQIDQVVRSNAGIFKLPAARQKFIEENTGILREAVANAKSECFKILAIESARALSIEAFDIRKGEVAISEDWVAELKESHTVRMSEKREKALELIANVEAAINELNALVADNKYFGSGITSSLDQRRCLMYISEDASVHVCKNEIEFIH